MTLMFLTRLHDFDASRKGVYFPHYIERMLEWDARTWLRAQRRGQATPFSQLGMRWAKTIPIWTLGCPPRPTTKRATSSVSLALRKPPSTNFAARTTNRGVALLRFGQNRIVGGAASWAYRAQRFATVWKRRW